MNKSIIPIKGMHCRSCEILIEEKLKEIPEIKSIQVNYKKAQALVYSREPFDLFEMNKINKAVEEAGYEVGIEDSKDWISRDPYVWKDACIAFLVLIALYFVARQFGLFNLGIAGSGNPSSLAVVLVVGLTAGFSTCMALVGGLVLGLSAKFSEKHPEATPIQKFRPHLFFNLGRIAAYFLLGGVIGLVGKAFQLSGGITGMLLILVGLVMLIVGAQLTELFPRLAKFSFSMPAGVSKFFGIRRHHEKEYSHTNSMITGALTFFLPCGFTQAMQLFAMSTGSFWSGALIMAIFAIGTAPGLLGIGGLISVVKGVFARRFFKGAGILVIALALFNISNGMNLSGLSTKFAGLLQDRSTSSTAAKDDPNVKLVDGVQVVQMTQNSYGYSPNSFTIKKGIPVKWVVTSIDANTCAASLYSQQINVRRSLRQGENVIEFTPTSIGKIPFSCSMGMYRGSFNVIENDTPNDAVDTSTQSDEGTSGASSQAPTKSSTPSPTTATNTAPASEPSAPANTDASNNQSGDAASQIQNIKATYTYANDISPATFTVKAGKPVRFEIDPEDDGAGCMSSITVPGLTDDYEILEKGVPIIFNFTPAPGKYQITCAMGVPRGTIVAE